MAFSVSMTSIGHSRHCVDLYINCSVMHHSFVRSDRHKTKTSLKRQLFQTTTHWHYIRWVPCSIHVWRKGSSLQGHQSGLSWAWTQPGWVNLGGVTVVWMTVVGTVVQMTAMGTVECISWVRAGKLITALLPIKALEWTDPMFLFYYMEERRVGGPGRV